MSITEQYNLHGIKDYYIINGMYYVNPHEHQLILNLPSIIKKWFPKLLSVIDLACGSGEITLILNKIYDNINIVGIDPYTYDNYNKRTGKNCIKLSFEEISTLSASNNISILLNNLCTNYDVIICSYALHLIDKSWLPSLLYQLSTITKYLIIISPHKRPIIDIKTGWKLIEEIRPKESKQRYSLYVYMNE